MDASYCFIDGKIISTADAHVGVKDIGLLRGFGIYEGISTFNSKPFWVEEHLDRFFSSLKGLGIVCPYTREEIKKHLADLIRKTNFPRTNIRIILTGGETMGGIEFDPKKPTFYMISEEWKSIDPAYYASGASLITHEYVREYPQWKTINYITAVLVQEKRKKAGALEVLYLKNDLISECSTGNIFIVKAGELLTPSRNVLPGITRLAVIHLAGRDIPFEERDISKDELMKADEIFITGSYKDIVPVVTVDGTIIGAGKVGPISKEIMKRFRDHTASY